MCYNGNGVRGGNAFKNLGAHILQSLNESSKRERDGEGGTRHRTFFFFGDLRGSYDLPEFRGTGPPLRGYKAFKN